MKLRITEYLELLDGICKSHPAHTIIPGENGQQKITVVRYPGFPGSGLHTTFTYGLSESHHLAWCDCERELVMTVRSSDRVWSLALGFICMQLAGKCPFLKDDFVRFHDKISPDSGMDAFLVGDQEALGSSFTGLRLGTELIQFSQLYPVFESEHDAVRRLGADQFLSGLASTRFDTSRRPVR